jgi:excinuclease ABC subunit B
MERAMAETQRRRDKQAAWNAEHGITPESVKSRIADILDSVYEKDHVRADIKGFAGNEGALIGNNLTAHLEALQKQMRDAAADLDFERAARLRDEIKRLREAELEISDDPLAREVERLSPASGQEKGRHNKGRARHRAVESGGFSPLEGEMAAKRPEGVGQGIAQRKGTSGASATTPPGRSAATLPSGGREKSLFAKPDLDAMGTSGDHAEPAGAIPRSLFRKQSAREAHGSDFGIPESERGRSLFRKNTLDEMTVRRTEKPVEGVKPARVSSPQRGEDGSPREAQPSGEANLVRGNDPKPIVRERAGLGSYEDPAEQKRRGRRTGKTGRPGR